MGLDLERVFTEQELSDRWNVLRIDRRADSGQSLIGVDLDERTAPDPEFGECAHAPCRLKLTDLFYDPEVSGPDVRDL